jgi:hypothetical protein
VDGTRTRNDECRHVLPGGATCDVSPACQPTNDGTCRQTPADCRTAEQPDPATATDGPRARLVKALAEAVAAASAAGDIHAARVAHDALGRLLGDQTPGTAEVTDLATERAKRTRDR